MRGKTRSLTRGVVAVAVAAAAVATLPTGPASAAAAKHVTLHPTGTLPTTAKVPAKVKMHATAALPASVDLRAGAPVPGDQGNVGSCVAWSIGYSLTGYYARSIANASGPYAPLYLYMRSVKGTPGPTGLYVSDAMTNEQNEGIDTQADYWQGTTNVTDWPTTGEISNAGNYKITGWTTLFAGAQGGTTAQTVLEQSLAAGTPVSITIPVYSAFDQINSMTPYSSTSGALRGYHEVTAYGYDSTGLIIRNSWGKSWGSAGDAKLAWSFVNSKVLGAYTISGVKANGQASVRKPVVSGLSAAKAAAGTTVTVTGTDLTGVTKVNFGTVPATFTNVTTASGAPAVAAVVPAQAVGKVVDVAVTNGAGTSATVAAGKFTYAVAAPTLTSLTPATATTLGTTVVTVAGTNLTGATVKVGNAAAAVRNVTATSLTFTAPVHAAGAVNVTVTTPGGATALPLTYVVPDAPTVTSLSATTASTRVATQLTVTGTSFVGTVAATVDGKTVSASKVSDTQLRITAPAHAAGTVPVVIKAAGGASAPTTLTYVAPAPAITVVSPAIGLAKGAVVTINGSSFTGTTSVKVGDTAATYQVISDAALRVTIPAKAAGVYVVTVTTASGTSAAGNNTKYTVRA